MQCVFLLLYNRKCLSSYLVNQCGCVSYWMSLSFAFPPRSMAKWLVLQLIDFSQKSFVVELSSCSVSILALACIWVCAWYVAMKWKELLLTGFRLLFLNPNQYLLSNNCFFLAKIVKSYCCHCNVFCLRICFAAHIFSRLIALLMWRTTHCL